MITWVARRWPPAFSIAAFHRPRDVTLLFVGNPQCAVPVEDFEFDWRAMGAEIESHPLFRTAPTSRFSEPWTSTSSSAVL